MKKMISVFLIVLQLSLWGNDTLQTTSACWSKGSFYECDKYQAPYDAQMVEGPSIYFAPYGAACYGHVLLDGVLPLYVMLKKHDLLDAPITLAIKLTPYEISNQTVCNILQLIKDVFHFKNIIILNSEDSKNKIYFENIVLNDYNDRYSGYYRTVPNSFNYISELKSFGMQDNIVFQDLQATDNVVKEFVNFIVAAYKINIPVIKNRVLIPQRTGSRRILNVKELVNHLKATGYDVDLVDFEKMSIKDQIIHTMQAEYVLGTYGSNLVNAIFLHPEANVVILWHKYAKYFWSRKYCIIHSAFLSTGVKLIEFDKPEYDLRDVYTDNVHVPEYFYRKKSQLILRPEKASLEEIVKYPLPAMYEFTNVDLYIPPARVGELLQKAKFLHHEPCQLTR